MRQAALHLQEVRCCLVLPQITLVMLPHVVATAEEGTQLTHCQTISVFQADATAEHEHGVPGSEVHHEGCRGDIEEEEKL